MAGEGARVVVVSRHEAEAALVVEEIRNSGGEAMAWQADVSRWSEVEAMARRLGASA